VIDFVGMIHLPALPGSPQAELSMRDCIDRALRDADALQAGGVDGIIVENFFDAPFRSGRVDPHTVAAMTCVCAKVREQVSCRIGVNVLRNDALSALGIAVAAEADFIRVNIHSGAMLTDQGIIQGEADDTLRLRRNLNAGHVQVFADVLVKHAVSLGPLTIDEAVRDATERGLADAIVVTGVATGQATLAKDVSRAVAAAGKVPVYVGSGASAENVIDIVGSAHGVIVGSWLKIDGEVRNPVDEQRVHRLRAALDTGR
jgi:membrane complex biogenesis BtpA family protein